MPPTLAAETTPAGQARLDLGRDRVGRRRDELVAHQFRQPEIVDAGDRRALGAAALRAQGGQQVAERHGAHGDRDVGIGLGVLLGRRLEQRHRLRRPMREIGDVDGVCPRGRGIRARPARPRRI